MLDGDRTGVEEHECDDEPEPVGRLADPPNEEPETLLTPHHVLRCLFCKKIDSYIERGCGCVRIRDASWRLKLLLHALTLSFGLALDRVSLDGVLLLDGGHLLHLVRGLLPGLHDLDTVGRGGALFRQDKVLRPANPRHVTGRRRQKIVVS